MDDIERVYMEVWTATMKLDNDNAVEHVRNSFTLRFKISLVQQKMLIRGVEKLLCKKRPWSQRQMVKIDITEGTNMAADKWDSDQK